MVPDNRAVELMVKWTRGDPEATRFLLDIVRLGNLADDIADGDAADPVASVAGVLDLAMAQLGNPFVARHADTLAPVIAHAIALWAASNRLQRHEDRRARATGWAWRAASTHLVHIVAHLVGGFDHMRSVIDELLAIQCAADPETFEDWEQEGTR